MLLVCPDNCVFCEQCSKQVKDGIVCPVCKSTKKYFAFCVETTKVVQDGLHFSEELNWLSKQYCQDCDEQVDPDHICIRCRILQGIVNERENK